MFREMRYSKRALGEEEAIKMLKDCEYGVLSTVGDDGYAYGVPLNFVYDGSAIYFHCAKEGHKLDNLRFNSKVSFCVVGEAVIVPHAFTTQYKSAVVFGVAREAEGAEKRTALELLIKKYSPDFLEKGMKYIDADIDKTCVFKINIEHISAKAGAGA
jgi:nitroimidazol reductase NimA-like FMN-containing flavoprotein (pyridoxamine 5'-phosphate oxidase superfamily)